ncbi:hypothetical protein [Actinoplanes sp. NPDC051859]|uniref:hypothetical protein n=1 Tax=Actinoplanes sp. NPDC051859 TaxID=3363909 RepID=UPI00379162EF
MRIILVRLWSTLGWGIVGLLIVLAALSFLLWAEADYGFLVLPASLLLTGIAAVAVRWGRYERSAHTAACSEALPGLLASREEFTLLLRPFGSDGETVVRDSRGKRVFSFAGMSPTATLEQIVARVVRAETGMRTVALVDPDRALAPPGPDYLRAPHDGWQPSILGLIRRAHSIVLVLHPGQDLRASFGWEIEQINLHQLQSRIVIVLPPADRDPAGYQQARYQACVIVAALEGFAGTIDDVDPLNVLQWESGLPDRVQVIKISWPPTAHRMQVLHWASIPPKKRSVVGAFTYAQCLGPALAIGVRDLDGISFAQRYPVERPLS